MNLLKKAMKAVFFAVIISTSFQCLSQKVAVAPKEAPPELKLQNPIVFQEWYAGIKIGGTGINMFIPKFDSNRNIQVDSVYFRNMKGKSVSKDTIYAVVFKNDSRNYVPNPSNAKTNPYNLGPNECIIKYTENGQIKLLKIASIVERAGTYYENGPPSISESTASKIIATIDED